MAYVNFVSGFNIGSKSAIDSRLVLTHAQMLTAETDFVLPDVYFCICPDDGKFYTYDKNNPVSNDASSGAYGKFRVFDSTITYVTEEAKENLNDAIADSKVINGDPETGSKGLAQETEDNTSAIETLNGDEETEGSVKQIVNETVSNITLDGGDI